MAQATALILDSTIAAGRGCPHSREFWRVTGPLSEAAVSIREVAADRAIKAW
jgi:hypothetical protein